jgi:ATP-binding cassette subfamily C (CFTR/MRP) protein 1
MPLIFFPFVVSSLTDALVALGRISKFLTAEELAEPYAIEYEQKNAVSVDGDFTWETAGKLEGPKFSGLGKDGKAAKRRSKMGKKGTESPVLPTTTNDVGDDAEKEKEKEKESEKEEEKPFELNNLKLNIVRGSFVAIVGRVGSGKVIIALLGISILGLTLITEFIASSFNWRNAPGERGGRFHSSLFMFRH